MITRLSLNYFKCFQELKLPLSPLTLLTGTNASGKSTILQSLVLLHQTMLDHEWSTRLQLNGSGVQLGTVGDVVNKIHGRRGFSIGLESDELNIIWVFGYEEDKQAMSLFVDTVFTDAATYELPQRLRLLLPDILDDFSLGERLRGLTYLTAERIGPRDNYALGDPTAVQVVGPRGGNAVGLLYQKREQKVLPKIVLPTSPPTLLGQVNARMNRFFPNASLVIEPVPQANIVTLGLRNSLETDHHRPVNIGFGFTQVLPILVAALASQENDLLLIENPEVHLHPAGQAKMGEFLAEIAAAGIQVIVESHSDHVLNGIRRAVKNKALSHDQCAIHFFSSRDNNQEQVISPTISSDGGIDHWPAGFFDQFDKDLNYFAGWGE